MNHAESLGAKQLFTPLRFRCQQVFLFHESFFAAPQGQLVGAKETYVSFSNPRQELFCHPGKFPSPSPLRTWPVRWRERLYAPFRPHRQAFSRKKFCILARFRRIILPTYRKDTEKCWHFFFQTPSSPYAKASCRQYQDVPAMSPAPCISARSRCKAATLPASPWQAHLPASQIAWPARRPLSANPCSTALQGAASPQTARIRTAPSPAMKKAGKGLPFPACPDRWPNPLRSGCCPRAGSGHPPRHSSV